MLLGVERLVDLVGPQQAALPALTPPELTEAVRAGDMAALGTPEATSRRRPATGRRCGWRARSASPCATSSPRCSTGRS